MLKLNSQSLKCHTLEMLDDLDYVRRCQSGEAEAFGVLYDRYGDKIYRFIYYKTFHKETADDLVSEVFLRALEKLATFDETRGHFSTWLYQIARNRVIDYYRTYRPSEAIEDCFDLGADERIPETLDAIQDLEAVTAYLDKLTNRQREIIILRIWEDKSYKEIAEIVGGTEDSVKMVFSRSIRNLREQFGKVALLVLGVGLPFSSLLFILAS